MPTLRDIGLFLFLGGLLVLLGFGAVKMLEAPGTPLPVRLGLLAVFLGVVLLFITLIKEQSEEDDEGVDRKY